MERTTRLQLESLTSLLDQAMRARGYTGPTLELHDRGADYPYRYGIVADGGRTYPFGERYERANELWDTLRLALRAVQELPVPRLV